jgi:dTMP kinase
MVHSVLMFITFEGTEGVGKSTQIDKIYNYLVSQNIPVIKSKEPGGTPFGLQLRKMLLDPNMVFKSDLTEVFLFYADRLEHVERVIKPALNENKVVLCDRYIDSTIAYQVGGRNMPEKLITTLNSFVTLKPNLTILMDMDLTEGLNRAQKRGDIDRFEQETLEFHKRVRQGYLNQAEKEPDRIKVVNVNRLSVEDTFTKILSIIKNHKSIAKFQQNFANIS